MLHWKTVFIWTLLCYYKGVQCTICSEAAASENIEVIRMCQSGSMSTRRVVIDTYDTGAPDVNSCTCTARQYITSSYLVSVGRAYKLEQNRNCGSVLSMESPENDPMRFECLMSDTIYSGKRSSLEFILSRTEDSSPWQSGYCILLETDNTKWNISCLPAEKVTTKLPTATTPQPTLATTSSSTAITISTGSGVTPPPSSVSVTQISSSNIPESSTKNICSPQTVEVFSTATVIVPIVIVVLIAAVATIANVILYRRRLALDSKPKNSHHVLRSSDSAVYDSIDVARLEPPHTYADTTAGRMYANTASDTSAWRLYENTSVGTTAT